MIETSWGCCAQLRIQKVEKSADSAPWSTARRLGFPGTETIVIGAGTGLNHPRMPQTKISTAPDHTYCRFDRYS